MLYIIIGKDRQNSLADRLSVRPAHLDRVQALLDEGRLIIGGPMPAIDSENRAKLGFLALSLLRNLPLYRRLKPGLRPILIQSPVFSKH